MHQATRSPHLWNSLNGFVGVTYPHCPWGRISTICVIPVFINDKKSEIGFRVFSNIFSMIRFRCLRILLVLQWSYMSAMAFQIAVTRIFFLQQLTGVTIKKIKAPHYCPYVRERDSNAQSVSMSWRFHEGSLKKITSMHQNKFNLATPLEILFTYCTQTHSTMFLLFFKNACSVHCRNKANLRDLKAATSLYSGSAQFGSKSVMFCPVWPWNSMDDLGKQ